MDRLKTLDEILEGIEPNSIADISHVKVDLMLYISKLTNLQEVQSCECLYSSALQRAKTVDQFKQRLDNEIQKYNKIKKGNQS